MAIVNNLSTEIGDVIRIQSSVPAVGIFALNTFLDDTINETATRYFEKFFRYSVDGGLNWSNWEDLTSINIQNIEVRRINIFVIEYRYTRSGTDDTEEIGVNSVKVSGTSTSLESPIFARQFFFRFFDINDPNVLGWALNVLEKLYERGILPDYIDRNNSEYNPLIEDEDFLAYWGTVTHFFAIFVYYARKFEEITTTPELIYQFLDNLGLFLNTNITDTHLLYLIDNYLEEFKKRGTGKIRDLGNENTPMGELRRLITFVAPDEFLLELLEPHATGWCIGKSSPTFNYTRHCMNLIKGYEIERGFSDLANYPISTIGSVEIIDSELVITPTQNTITGIYSVDNDKYIEIDDLVDYEIIVRARQDGIIDECLNFGCLCQSETRAELSLISLSDLSNSNFFFESKGLHKAEQEYEIRGVIHGKQFNFAGINPDDFSLNIGFGSNLKFNPIFKTRYILPFFYVNRNTTATDSISIIDFKIRPMRFNFTLGKFGLKNILYFLYRNNSTYFQHEVYRNAVNKLIPYNTSLIDNEVTTII